MKMLVSKGTLVAFRKRLIEGQMDRRLIERTIEIANQSQAFGSRPLRAALDSSPLWGAGRVEDTCNLVGHALKKVMCVVADHQERDLVDILRPIANNIRKLSPTTSVWQISNQS